MKKLLSITIFIFISVSNAQGQGITNTLGGSTADDKFIIENKNSETGIVITGEGDVGLKTDNPVYDLDLIKQSGEAYFRIRSDDASSSLIIDKYSVSHLGQIVYQHNHVSKFFTGLLGNNNYRISTDRFSLNGLEVQNNGQIKISGGNPGAGKTLTSDENGLASWEDGKYEVGDFAQGGIIFWLDETGKHGLVCAKNDQSSGDVWTWNSAFTDWGAHGDGPFSGEMNTMIIVANQKGDIGGEFNGYAARTSSEYVTTENSFMYGDWYLPSKNELYLMFQNKAIIDASALANGGSSFSTDYYWSSTEEGQYTAFTVNFSTGSQTTRNKVNYSYSVRAVRAF